MRKVSSYLAVVVGMGVIAPLGFASAAGASTTRVVHPGESIQAVVDASASGDTVRVESGTYAQTVGIHTSGIKLDGRGARLVPPASGEGFDCTQGGELADGICVTPAKDSDPPLDGVTIQGMTVSNFPGSGIFAINQTNLTYNRNTAIDNEEYGIAAFSTVGTRMLQNRAVGSEEANIYLGDSPGANGLIRGNRTHRGALGIFIRNSEGVQVQNNDARNNCVGILVLADSPGPAGDVIIRHNTVLANSLVCAPSDEAPPLSGAGIVLAGAHDVTIQSNVIQGNVPGGPTAFDGGVVLASLFEGGTPPMNNKISNNVLNRNSTDVLSDGTATGTVIRNNICGSNPGDCA